VTERRIFRDWEGGSRASAAASSRAFRYAMLRGDSRTNPANGACGWHKRHDSHGTRLVIAASG
jgi:hypothetical protein